MTDMKHSPSPFVKDEFIPGLIRDANGTAIASVGVINVHTRREEGEANGSLFLSAPDMLAALKGILLKLEQNSWCFQIPSEEKEVRAAIAKAEGK